MEDIREVIDLCSVLGCAPGALFKFRTLTCYVSHDNVLFIKGNTHDYITASRVQFELILRHTDEISWIPGWAPGYPVIKEDPEEPWTHNDVTSSGSLEDLMLKIKEFQDTRSYIYETSLELRHQIQVLSDKHNAINNVLSHLDKALDGLYSELTKYSKEV